MGVPPAIGRVSLGARASQDVGRVDIILLFDEEREPSGAQVTEWSVESGDARAWARLLVEASAEAEAAAVKR